jgi:ethanolamine utilization microcompartment shell protein EutS
MLKLSGAVIIYGVIASFVFSLIRTVAGISWLLNLTMFI